MRIHSGSRHRLLVLLLCFRDRALCVPWLPWNSLCPTQRSSCLCRELKVYTPTSQLWPSSYCAGGSSAAGMRRLSPCAHSQEAQRSVLSLSSLSLFQPGTPVCGMALAVEAERCLRPSYSMLGIVLCPRQQWPRNTLSFLLV